MKRKKTLAENETSALAGQGEDQYLSAYEQDKYRRPSVAADIVTITVREEKSGNYRKTPRRHLSLLLVKRGVHPFQNCWALPGGFLRPGESIEQCALRELKEETGVEQVTLLPLECFSQPDRDPRGWIVSNGFIAIASSEEYQLHSGTDALEAEWFDVSYRLKNQETQEYVLTLSGRDQRIEAILRQRSSRFGQVKLELIQSEGIAFDHGQIIASALHKLRREIGSHEIAFEFVPEQFTLQQLQQVYEIVLDEPLLTPNFRRKIGEYVEATEDRAGGAGHRPAKMFKKRSARPL